MKCSWTFNKEFNELKDQEEIIDKINENDVLGI